MANAKDTPDPQWTTVSEEDVNEIKFAFDVIGDELIGTYLGTRDQSNDNGSYTQYRYEDTDDGTVYFVNGNYSLSAGMRTVRIGSLCRITYVADKDTGQATPMRIYRVDVARRNVRPAKGQPGATPTAKPSTTAG